MPKRIVTTWPINLEELQTRIQYTFKDASLLALVVRHESKGALNNERLEALGNKVLECVIVEALYHKYPDSHEGRLSGITNRICSNYSILDHARAIRLSVYTFNLPIAKRDEAMSDAFQALVGAIYLDGGFDSVRAFILREFEGDLSDLTPAPQYQQEFNSFVRRHFNQEPIYVDQSKIGAKLQGHYKYDVKLGDAVVGKGRGHNSAQAKANAARVALKYLKQLYPGLE